MLWYPTLGSELLLNTTGNKPRHHRLEANWLETLVSNFDTKLLLPNLDLPNRDLHNKGNLSIRACIPVP